MARKGHRRTGSQGRWKGWNRRPEANPVTVVQGPVRKAPPMTEPQIKYLKKLCNAAGVPFNPKWTKRQAQVRINQLKRRTP